MGRRFKRLKRFANHVVRVTRTAFMACICGERHAVVQQYAIPAAAFFTERGPFYGVVDDRCVFPAKQSSGAAFTHSRTENTDLASSRTTKNCPSGTSNYDVSSSGSRNSQISSRSYPGSGSSAHFASSGSSCTTESSGPSLSTSSESSGDSHSEKSGRSSPPHSDKTPSSIKQYNLCDIYEKYIAANVEPSSLGNSGFPVGDVAKKRCLVQHQELSPIEPVQIYSTCPKWAAIFPTSVQVVTEFNAGAVGQVELVSSGEDRFVRKVMVDDEVPVYEAAVTIDVQCEFVVKLLACFTQDKSTYFHFPYYSMGDLLHWIEKDGSRSVFTEDMCVLTILHILAGIRKIHMKGIIHMDIKPSNVLINNRGYPLLTDFGGAIRMSDPFAPYCFTREYLCPEFVFDDTSLVMDGMADIWAAGVTFYQLLTGKLPSYSKDPGTTNPRNNALLLECDDLSVAAQDFLTKVLAIEPYQRIGFFGGVDDVLEHELFKGWIDTVDERGLDSPLLSKLVQLDDG